MSAASAGVDVAASVAAPAAAAPRYDRPARPGFGGLVARNVATGIGTPRSRPRRPTPPARPSAAAAVPPPSDVVAPACNTSCRMYFVASPTSPPHCRRRYSARCGSSPWKLASSCATFSPRAAAAPPPPLLAASAAPAAPPAPETRPEEAAAPPAGMPPLSSSPSSSPSLSQRDTTTACTAAAAASMGSVSEIAMA
eukprot:169779-Chlamydomonas_euryale.AAC.3